MDMILDATDDDRLATKIRQDAAELAMQFFAKSSIAEKGPSVLG
jgi:hypothetical protein